MFLSTKPVGLHPIGNPGNIPNLHATVLRAVNPKTQSPIEHQNQSPLKLDQ